jgi:hypothetical protein
MDSESNSSDSLDSSDSLHNESSSSNDYMEQEKPELSVLSELRDFCLLALERNAVNNNNNILMLQKTKKDKKYITDSMWQKFHDYTQYCYEDTCWDPDDKKNDLDGPPCHICKKEIVSHCLPVSHKGLQYWFFHEDSIFDGIDKEYGMYSKPFGDI